MATVEAIHRLIAYGAIALVATGCAWSVLLAVTGRPAGPAFDRFQAALVSLLVVGAASGGILLATGTQPGDGLHLVYAAIALAVVPLARSFGDRSGGRAATVLILGAFVVLGGLLYRLFTTG